MSTIEGRIVDTAEKMMRRLYKLNEDYEVSSYSVKPNFVEITMANELITLKGKIPTTLVEENILYQADIDKYEEEAVKNVKKAPVRNK